MPLSMAIAGPLGATVGVTTVFLVAGVAPGFLAVAAIMGARLDRDEILHPLDRATGEFAETGPTLRDRSDDEVREPATPRRS